MEQLENYRHYIQNLIKQYQQYKPSYGDIEMQAIFDEENDHYQLFTVGWNGKRRVHGCILHFDIKNNKIWIQHDGTDVGMADELVEMGVPKEDIVLAFHAPSKRPYTGFAVN
jgi:hypothetical protein